MACIPARRRRRVAPGRPRRSIAGRPEAMPNRPGEASAGAIDRRPASDNPATPRGAGGGAGSDRNQAESWGLGGAGARDAQSSPRAVSRPSPGRGRASPRVRPDHCSTDPTRPEAFPAVGTNGRGPRPRGSHLKNRKARSSLRAWIIEVIRQLIDRDDVRSRPER
jgi:hypothetical protein